MKTIAITSPAIHSEDLLRSALDRISYLESELQKLHKSISTPIGNIRIRQANRVITSSPKEIMYVQSENNYSRLFMKDGSQYYTSRTLKSWAKELSTSGFLRCHRTYLVNRTAVTDINKQKSIILIQGGIAVPTSRRFQKSCLSVIAPYTKQNPESKIINL